MPNSSTLSRLLAAVFAFGLLLAVAGPGISQSGRRAKPKAAPVPTPEPAATPATATPAEKPKPQLTFIVGMDRFGDFGGIPLYTYSTVLRHCVSRLAQSSSISARAAEREMNRSDAIKRAKAETEANIVYLELRPDTVSGDTRGTSSLSNVYLQYTVFAPTTAKIVSSGRTYPQAYRTRGVIVRPTTSGVTGDYELNQAAEEAAERILRAVKVPAPPYR
jgi:Na+-transporting methylmalonyl-CoA/oxaloacetate decarboxylase gamma subunit